MLRILAEDGIPSRLQQWASTNYAHRTHDYGRRWNEKPGRKWDSARLSFSQRVCHKSRSMESSMKTGG
jgi:hypothetical protein